MSRIISALLLIFSSLLVPAQSSFADQVQAPQETPAPALAANAPARHVVVPGDTLWGIAAKFLKEPFRWPEIWGLNREQIRNPHLIYPGQVVVLDTSSGRPLLKIEAATETVDKLEPRIYSSENRVAIPSIPQEAIEPFLSEPLVVEAHALDQAPRIIATRGDRVYAGAGDTVYVAGIKEPTKLWQVYRPGKALIDPDTQETLGYEAVYLGTARVVREGEPSTVDIVSSRQEIGRGDRLVPAVQTGVIRYVPHAPDKTINGRIISIYDGVGVGGNQSVVALSRGSRDGLEVGHVLAIYDGGAKVSDRFEGKKKTYQLPDEKNGLLFVFRVFDRVSYALVMNAARPVAAGDIVRTP